MLAMPRIELSGFGFQDVDHEIEYFESSFDQEGSFIELRIRVEPDAQTTKDTVKSLVMSGMGLFEDISIKNVHHKDRNGTRIDREILKGRYRLKAYSVRGRTAQSIVVKMKLTTMPKVIDT